MRYVRGGDLKRWAAMALAMTAIGVGGCESDPDRAVSRERLGQREALMRRAEESDAALHAAVAAEEAPYYVFTSFRDRSDGYGLFLAVSRDGFTWRNVSRTPLLEPVADNRVEMRELNEGGWWWTSGARGMRDPCLARGPDGTFHLVWTWQRGSRSSIGYAQSDDLLTWRDVRMLRMTPPEWTVDYCWAPALVHDPEGRWWPVREEAGGGPWLIVWSCAVKGRFEETAKLTRHNHRLYARRTADFETFSPAELFFDPGYPVIDADFYLWSPGGKKVPADAAGEDGIPVLFFKDELRYPEKKQVRMAWWEAKDAPPSGALTTEMCEGPSAIEIDGMTIVYFDEYTRRNYGAIRSADLRQWEDVTPLMSFPTGHRHGSVLKVEPVIGRRLEEMADDLAGRAKREPALAQ